MSFSHNNYFLIGALVLGISAVAFGQDKNPAAAAARVVPVLKVSLGEDVPTNVPIGAIFDPMRCDRQGNMYARIGALDKLKQAFGAPIYRIDPDGRSTAFEFDRLPDVAGKNVGAFTFDVDRTGGVHAVVRTLEMKRDGVEALYVVSFARDGTYRSRFEINSKYRPTHLVALANGYFYITGLLAKDKSVASSSPQSISVLLDANGRLIRDMKERSDDHPPKDQAVKGYGKVPIIENPAIQMGDAWEGPDGNLYIFRGTVPTRVQVFSLDGTLVRTVQLRSPFPEVQSTLVAAGPDRLWVTVFGPPELDDKGWKKSQAVNYVIYDLNTGEPLFEVDVSNIHAPVACAVNDELLILKPTPTGTYAVVRGTVGR